VRERGKLIVQQSLDTGAELLLSPASQSAASRTVDDTKYAHTAAAVLLAFLRSLPESIVPLSLHRRCAEITNRDEAIEVMWLSVVVPRRHG